MNTAALTVHLNPGDLVDLRALTVDGTGRDFALKVTGGGDLVNHATLVLPNDQWIGGIVDESTGPVRVISHGLCLDGRGHQHGLMLASGNLQFIQAGGPLVDRPAVMWTAPLPTGADGDGQVPPPAPS